MSETGKTAFAAEVEKAQLAADVAKLDLITAQAREQYGDDRLTIVDIAAILRTAREFRVPNRAAYLRARDLGVLSYQRAGRS